MPNGMRWVGLDVHARRPGDRIKTDRRDAIRPARLFAAGDLRLVWIPSQEQEQLRDLVRCREDLRSDLMRARHPLKTPATTGAPTPCALDNSTPI